MKKTGFFKVSMETLRAIARETKNPDLLAGFLVMARHGTGNIIANRLPFTFTGAGANAIKDKVGVGEATAKGILDHLQDCGLIKPSPKDVIITHQREARYELVQGEVNLDLPHSFVDGLGKVADSAIKRSRSATVATNYANELNNISQDELRLDVLMLLLEMYEATNMTKYGGINPSFLFRKWKIETIREKNGSFEWFAIPEMDTSFKSIIKDIFQHSVNISEKGKAAYPDNLSERFWNAFQSIKHTGLIYEAVTMFDADPKNPSAKAICTIRINDYHANDDEKDPSLLQYAIDSGFYTQAINDRDDPEQIRFKWLNKNGYLIGIYRPRFRAINQDTGIWIDQDTTNCNLIANTLSKKQKEMDEVGT